MLRRKNGKLYQAPYEENEQKPNRLPIVGSLPEKRRLEISPWESISRVIPIGYLPSVTSVKKIGDNGLSSRKTLRFPTHLAPYHHPMSPQTHLTMIPPSLTPPKRMMRKLQKHGYGMPSRVPVTFDTLRSGSGIKPIYTFSKRSVKAQHSLQPRQTPRERRRRKRSCQIHLVDSSWWRSACRIGPQALSWDPRNSSQRKTPRPSIHNCWKSQDSWNWTEKARSWFDFVDELQVNSSFLFFLFFSFFSPPFFPPFLWFQLIINIFTTLHF